MTLLSSCKKMSRRVVRSHPPKVKSVFWEFFLYIYIKENVERVFFFYHSSPFFLASHLVTFLFIYIWGKEDMLTRLAGSMVIIAAHKAVKQSWPLRRKMAVFQKDAQMAFVISIYDFQYEDLPSDLRRSVVVPSSITHIKYKGRCGGYG